MLKKKLILALLLLNLLTACGATMSPLELTQTTVSLQQSQLQLTQSALSLGITQTALASEQDRVNTQIASTQTREAIPVISHNMDWTPQEREFNGVQMVLVPMGCFMMGADDLQWDHMLSQSGMTLADLPDDQIEELNLYFQAHEQCFHEPFWIDKYEVTQAEFARLGGTSANGISRVDNHPVDQITWIEARDYCEEIRGGRLPTEREWEYVARGPDNLIFPWGNEWNESNAVWNVGESQEVGSIPRGVSWVGALDMIGNVREWTSSFFESYPYNPDDGRETNTNSETDRVARGGAYFYTERDRDNGLLNSIFRLDRSLVPKAGFRCVRSE